MELEAAPTTVNDLLSVNKKFVVPRFQREYSWDKERVRDLWEDITSSIVRGKTLAPSEYFIGPVVLIGKDTSTTYQIVDGQQRLTTLTMLLRALVTSLSRVGDLDAANALYDKFLEGKDDDGKVFFKLETETPKPYFQKAIQYRTVEDVEPITDEERNLKSAFEQLLIFLSQSSLSDQFPGYAYTDVLRAIRDQVLRYVKIVNIRVSDEDDAYTIFETLNARGVDLSTADLVRNALLKQLRQTHPNDDAKDLWHEIRTCCAESKTDADVFLRHFWLSRFGHTTEGKLYRSFKQGQRDGKIGDPKKFLVDLRDAATVYRQVSAPNRNDWRERHRFPIFTSVQALQIFGVTQVRPIALAILQSDILGDTGKKNALTVLEHFHFLYTAVCSGSPSGLDRKYGALAREIRAAKRPSEAKRCVAELASALRDKQPATKEVIEAFSGLTFSKDDDSKKRLIQYFFEKYETYLRDGRELVPDDMTLEHVTPQVGGSDAYALIGNLIPLAGSLNREADTKGFLEKRQIYEASNFRVVKEFLSETETATHWTAESIRDRTKNLGKLAAEKIFRITESYHAA